VAKRRINHRQRRRINANRDQKVAKAKGALDTFDETQLSPELKGLVVKHVRYHVEVEDQSRSRYRCHLRQHLSGLVVGDEVVFRVTPDGHGVVEARLERRSELIRHVPYEGGKAIAANVDQMFIVSAPKPDFNSQVIDRYLVAAENLNITPIVVLNKLDLLSRPNALKADIDTYTSLGYQCLLISTKKGDGLSELKVQLQGANSIFVGQSGVGKSSIVNALLPQLALETQPLSENSGLGQHTTTSVNLYHLPESGTIIDSPGVREFSLWHIDKDQLVEGFIEFRSRQHLCKFRDCLHLDDPGCAIKHAVEEREISFKRYDSYQRILQSIMDNQ
tara:strand:+ start:361 stop:1359 length:999 start_codon:yes stop_codon:yes gene_type:complete